ncbi:TonB-dependent receptor [Blastomonas sp. CCH5-A3]|uniref:TonB-dependent receptor domain-containing protein n=1 Tax=Blastomonas sp. CCH5-A3 TaxID=1768761 RepID=UPI000826504B|nr:TonB-dependent receptor [Blastomonas sp. CCH5-A3]MAF63903.1 TonB-dependent receptor [Blastomonas sp.]|tara:strand:+ start:92478 stop:95726 length:3249 start_codon:yes stop_codon:yes gene_type:complete
MKTQFKLSLLGTSLLVGAAALATPAYAQDQDQEQDQASGGDSTIVVTGSLISNPNLERSAPVNVTSSDEIELLQSNVAEEILREIPGVVPSIGSAVNNGNGGASFVNLRGLGSNRNIVLLDGTRIVPAGLAGVFDLNNVPLALIERVEVLTGGASTTYGADAISGVVNFVTRQDFAGLEANIGSQITERGDGHTFRADVTMGANFDDGRGNAVFSVGYQQSDPVYQGARDVSLDTLDTFSGGQVGSGTAFPSRFSGVRRAPGGVINRAPESIFTGRGAPTAAQPLGVPIYAPNPAGAANGGTDQVNSAGVFVPTFSTFNFNPFNIFQTPFERFNIFGAAKYEVSDSVEIYTRGMFSKNTVDTIIAPSGAFGIGVNVNLSNPFLSATARNQFCAFDVNPRPDIYTPRFTQAECDAAANARPGDAAYREVGRNNTFVPFDVNNDGTISRDPVTGALTEGYFSNPQTALFRRSVEAGPRLSNFATTLFDYKLGARGSITDTIDWDVFGSYGESENRQTIRGYFTNSRVRQSLLTTTDAAGNVVCQNAANGCVPANFFGDISPEAVNFLVQESSSFVKTSLAQARATISGDFGVTSPWAAEPISFAVGGEYRKYRASQGADTLAQSGDLGGAGGATPNISGGYDVYEAIGEVIVPIVSDRPFFQSLTLEGGFRYSDYSVDAPGSPGYTATTYKVGGTWEPVQGVSIRGNYARAVRAPNISELFSPVNTGLTNLGVDPCATQKTDGSTLRPPLSGELLAVCLAQGANAGNVQSIPEPISGQVLATGGGNLGIRPEKSDSYTVGLVLQPSFLPGFSASIDYYNIKVKQAITAPTPADVIGTCFGVGNNGIFNPAAGASSTIACTSIRRDPITGGLSGDPNTSTGLPSTLSNSGSLETDGIDVSINYATDLTDDIGLALSFVGNYTFQSRFNAFVASPISVNRDCVGYISTNCGSLQPEFQWSQRTTLTFKDVDVSLLWRHLSSFQQEPLDVIDSGPFFSGTLSPNVPGVGGRTVNFGRIKAYDYFDLSARFNATESLTFTLSVQNLFDKEPPLTGNNAGTTAFNSGNTFPSTYDALGRRYAVAARLRF